MINHEVSLPFYELVIIAGTVAYDISVSIYQDRRIFSYPKEMRRRVINFNKNELFWSAGYL